MNHAVDPNSIGEARRGWGTRRYLYVIAILSASMGTFGPGWGLAAAGGALVVQALASRPSHPLLASFLGTSALLFAYMLLPAVQEARTPSLRNMSMNNLKQLALACFNHHDVKGTWPRAYTQDEDGKRLHSWRTSVLPFLEEQALYASLSHDEPWSNAANQKALRSVPSLDSVFQSPRYPRHRTSLPYETDYRAVIGEETVWPPEGAITHGDITDAPGKTIVMIEVGGLGGHWFEPRDLSVEEAIDLLVGKTSDRGEFVNRGFFVSRNLGADGLFPRLVAFADGHVESIGYFRSREMARAFLTRAGGEETPYASEVADGVGSSETRVTHYQVHWLRIGSLTLFAVLAIAPVFSSGRRVLFGRS